MDPDNIGQELEGAPLRLSPPPTGTVTFLFTDIEDSARLAQNYPEDMPALLNRHDTLVHEAIARHGGHVFRTMGDAFCAAFARASNALAAALDAQRSLQREPWHPTPISVRMGLHTGEAQVNLEEGQLEGYAGYLTLTRVQRVMSAAYGGQVLLSGATVELLRTQLPPDVRLADLGEHRLKGLRDTEHLWQAVAPDLRCQFPPPPTLATVPNNLPLQLTSLVGREEEIIEVVRLLGRHRLVTLTGSGGAGKTRLSLEVAAAALDNFKDGAWFIELAPLSTPELILPAVARVLGLRETQDAPLLEAVLHHLADRRILLILDNCEHLIEACARLADALLRSSGKLRVLASSREALGVEGELLWRVPSLPVPDPQRVASADQIEQYAAVQLFVERARLAKPTFSITSANAPALASVCYRLDGMPLAIELAAARTAVLSLEQIAVRLGDRFRLLTGGSRTVLPRHQTLRAAIDWSHDLLPEPERVLFRWLSVFADGCTLEAAESVCSAGEVSAPDVLDLLARLADKSLVIADERVETRYRMQETIREYALGKLRATGELQEAAARHRNYFAALAAATPAEGGDGYSAYLDRLETEHDNLVAALRFTLDQGEAEQTLRLCNAVWPFWNARGYWTEARGWFAQALAQSRQRQASGSTSQTLLMEHTAALQRSGFLAAAQGDAAAAEVLLQEALANRRLLGDEEGTAGTLHSLAYGALVRGDYATAESLFSECLAIFRRLGSKIRIADTTWALGVLAKELEQYARAEELFKESMAYYQELEDKSSLGLLSEELAWLAMIAGDYAGSRKLAEESLALRQDTRETYSLGAAYRLLGILALHEGDCEQARAALRLALANFAKIEIGSAFICLCLTGMAAADVREGYLERGVRLMAAIEADSERTGRYIKDISLQVYNRSLATSRTLLGDEAFQVAWSEGQQLSVDEAVALAVA